MHTNLRGRFALTDPQLGHTEPYSVHSLGWAIFGLMALVVTQGILSNPTMSIVPVMYGLLMLVPILALVVSVRMYERQRFFAG